MSSAESGGGAAGIAGAAVDPSAAAAAAWGNAPWWQRGLRNGVLLGLIALAAILLLNREDLTGLGAVLVGLPAALAISAAVHLPQILFTALAWRVLLPRGPMRPPAGVMVLLRWYRESANALLPAGALVGQAAAARLLARRSAVPGEIAGATATVDFTVEAASQLVFTLAGIALLLAAGGAGIGTAAVIGGAALAGGAVAAMVAAQRRLPLGLMERGLARLARRWPALRPPAWIGAFQQAVLRLHTERGALAAAMLWHGAAWALGAVEIAGLLWLLGHPVTLAEALVIESLAQALRNVGFMLPGAAAVQEGAILAAAALVGVPPGPALTAALVRRGREVLLALPGLIAWRRTELAGAGRTAA